MKWILTSFLFFPPPLFFYSLSGYGRIPTARREIQWRISAPGAENKRQERMRRDRGNLGWKLLNLIRVNLQRAIVCKSHDCWALPCARGDRRSSRRGLRTTAVDPIKTKEKLHIMQNEQFCRLLIWFLNDKSSERNTKTVLQKELQE